MTKTIRITALLLAALLCLPLLLCSCGAKDKNNIAEDKTVIRIGGHDVSYGLYRYFFLNYRRIFYMDVSYDLRNIGLALLL